MPELLGLSTELIVCIATFLDQIDLLNVSLTSKYTRNATERELYSICTNP